MDLIRSLYSSYYFSNLHFLFIVLHVTAALVALVVAPVAMVVSKGGRTHRQWGLVYVGGMLAVNGSGLALLTWRFNMFLFGITMLTLYNVVTGYRALQHKRPTVAGQQPTWFDRTFAGLGLLVGGAMVVWGVATLLGLTTAFIPAGSGARIMLGILPLIFGGAVSHAAVTDLRLFRTPPTDRHWWWYYHMERMVGSYIGLFTALMVQQVGPRMPEAYAWIVWVAPSIIGSPLLALWITSYRRKFAGNRVQPVGSVALSQ